MKTNIIAVTGISLLVFFVVGFASIFEIRLASAQVDASSSPPVSPESTTMPPDLVASTSTALIADSASSTPELVATSTTADATTTPVSMTTTASSSPEMVANVTTVASTSPGAPTTPYVEPPPKGLALVHIIGTKYIDYFTDGPTTAAFPGDPAIDSHFNVPNAPIPTHEGLTWDHTEGKYLYDTPSGDLERLVTMLCSPTVCILRTHRPL
jgi:hypothetical protein